LDTHTKMAAPTLIPGAVVDPQQKWFHSQNHHYRIGLTDDGVRVRVNVFLVSDSDFELIELTTEPAVFIKRPSSSFEYPPFS
jgi:hypothetical protein